MFNTPADRAAVFLSLSSQGRLHELPQVKVVLCINYILATTARMQQTKGRRWQGSCKELSISGKHNKTNKTLPETQRTQDIASLTWVISPRVWRISRYSNIFKYFPIQIFVRIIFFIWIYSDICSYCFFDTNIFGYSFVSFFYTNIFGYSFVSFFDLNIFKRKI